MLVIKVGGSSGIELPPIVSDLAELWRQGERFVVVHGGSAETNRIAEALGHPPRFLTHPNGMTSRLTDRPTLEIFEMVYCGLVNKRWVELCQQVGLNAVGLSGLDGRLLEGRRKEAIRYVEGGKLKVHRGDLSGSVERVNAELLQLLLAAGYLPVLTPPALSEQSEAINTDGDTAAAQVAIALKATTLLLLSNVPGLLARFPDESSLVREIPAHRVGEPTYMEMAQGRMKKKILAAQQALQGGVQRVILARGQGEHPIQRALAGEGTVIG
jgi:acetylglutamate/LysW-gamma-L-alpha-aminoadipate kinase